MTPASCKPFWPPIWRTPRQMGGQMPNLAFLCAINYRDKPALHLYVFVCVLRPMKSTLFDPCVH